MVDFKQISSNTYQMMLKVSVSWAELILSDLTRLNLPSSLLPALYSEESLSSLYTGTFYDYLGILFSEKFCIMTIALWSKAPMCQWSTMTKSQQFVNYKERISTLTS